MQIMDIRFNVEKEERKALVKAIAEIAGREAVYKGAPSFAFVVGDYIIDRHGTLSFDEWADFEYAQRLLAELTERGFVGEGEGIDDLMMPSEPARAVPIDTVDTGDSIKEAPCPVMKKLHEETSPSGVTAYYLLHNTGDSGEGAGLCAETFSLITEKVDKYIICTETCCMCDSIMKQHGIKFRKIPRDLTLLPATVREQILALKPGYIETLSAEPKIVVDEVRGKLIVEVPLEGFTHSTFENLGRLVSGKAQLIMKAIGAEELPIERGADAGTIRFPWFPAASSDVEADAYKRLIHALCEMAKKQKRVILKEKAVDEGASEKFAFRCFLLRLGFIGKEYASARKVLLSKLSGNGSFKSGDHKKRGTSEDVADTSVGSADIGIDAITGVQDDDADVTEALLDALLIHEVNALFENESVIAVPERCSECPHHCYYSDGEMRSDGGEIVDTSKKKPNQYTHYCVKTPGGFRRLKHAVDWSGGETPSAWCPLKNSGNTGGEVSGDE